MSVAVAPDLASGMVKLTRKRWPLVGVPKYPSRQVQIAAQLDATRAARSARDESFLERMAVKFKLGNPTPSLDQQVQLLEEKAAFFDSQVITADLVPLSESETYLVRAHYTALMLFLKKKLLNAGLSKEAEQSVNQSIDIQCSMAWQKKWVGLSLRPTGKDEPLFPEGLPDDIEPDAIGVMYLAYHSAFTPTEDELKKSLAPTTQKRS